MQEFVMICPVRLFQSIYYIFRIEDKFTLDGEHFLLLQLLQIKSKWTKEVFKWADTRTQIELISIPDIILLCAARNAL